MLHFSVPNRANLDVDQLPAHENEADDQNAKNAADSINYDT